MGTETVSLNVTYNANKQVTLSGQLVDGFGDPMAGQTINLGGAVSGTTTTNAQGAYSVALTASALAQVTAASADGKSNTASFTLAGGTPAISNFQATCQGGGEWDFTGTVTGAPTPGEIVTLDGIPAVQGAQVSVNPNGTFAYFCTINSGGGGLVGAQATDWWGDQSAEVETSVPV